VAAATYLIAIGSNRWHARHRAPADVVRAAAQVVGLTTLSDVVSSAALGPSRRRYANAVGVVVSDLAPLAMLAHLKTVERAFGRRGGRRWGARVLDLDIVAWSGGRWATRTLTIPHPAWSQRAFVAVPLAQVAPRWRDPLTGIGARHAIARLRARGAGVRLPRHRKHVQHRGGTGHG